ncbi:hypothetical protein HPB52_011147 [Rhipicephalus sanguineus]|uniref:Monocarboxylate transporter n=1 Tax=Rhipicephalus sanguineus TaxID=34632 RepID=A0A9D4PWW2_RHISA|nr:hypothetical protein HPB52_011147 [Rhipicephalus sanguineus]
MDDKPQPQKRRAVNRANAPWRVSVVGGLIVLFATGVFGTSGLFYVYFMEAFGVSREAASWPASTMAVTLNCSGLVVSLLQRFMSIFQVSFLGSILLWTSLMFAAFAPSMQVMTLLFGAIHGLGLGFVENAVAVIIATSFLKHKSFAMGLKDSGRTLSRENTETSLTSDVERPTLNEDQKKTAPANSIQVDLLFGDPKFYVLAFQNTVMSYSSFMFRSMIVDYARDKGVPLAHAELMGTYCAASDLLLGHMGLPFLADRGFSLLISATASFSPVLITDYLGASRVPITCGVSGIVTGPLLLATPSITACARPRLLQWRLITANARPASPWQIIPGLNGHPPPALHYT